MRAVVFDCDGVLVDSEPLSERAWASVLGERGYTPATGDYEATRGMSSADTEAYFSRFVEEPEGGDLVPEVNVVLQALLATELEAFPDAMETVRTLASEGVPLAVASSSMRVNLDIKLAMFDLTRYFDVTVAGDEVPRAKPAPDIFTAAAAGLSVAGANCIAIDDTEVGADAAVAAGMRTVRLGRNGEVSQRHPTISILDADLILHWLGIR